GEWGGGEVGGVWGGRVLSLAWSISARWRSPTRGVALHASARIVPHQPVPITPTVIVFMGPPALGGPHSATAAAPCARGRARRDFGPAWPVVGKEQVMTALRRSTIVCLSAGLACATAQPTSREPLPAVDVVIGNNF